MHFSLSRRQGISFLLRYNTYKLATKTTKAMANNSSKPRIAMWKYTAPIISQNHSKAPNHTKRGKKSKMAARSSRIHTVYLPHGSKPIRPKSSTDSGWLLNLKNRVCNISTAATVLAIWNKEVTSLCIIATRHLNTIILELQGTKSSKWERAKRQWPCHRWGV